MEGQAGRAVLRCVAALCERRRRSQTAATAGRERWWRVSDWNPNAAFLVPRSELVRNSSRRLLRGARVGGEGRQPPRLVLGRPRQRGAHEGGN